VRSVRGIASDVQLDTRAHEAIKRYRRQPVISALYRASFQAPFPYVSNMAALKAAKYRRRIAGLITKYLMGRDVVAQVRRIERTGGGHTFVTELIEGGEPKDHKRARAFLHEVTHAFIQSGLPTWQVSPYNPRSLGNLIETPDGEYRVIDLESNVVTPMVPLSGVWGAARTAHLPPFDDIDVPKLLRFVSREWDGITARLGEEDAHQLARSIARYVWYEDLWQKNEPRIWSRGLRRVAAFLDLPAHVRRLARGLRRWAERVTTKAENWVEAGIARWEENGIITRAEADGAREDLQSGPVIAVLGHLGGQIAISIPLRFPAGSLARLVWAAAFRARAELRAATRRAAPEETRVARGTHSIAVMCVAAIPGLGAAAYVLASPLRKNAVLFGAALDQAFRLLPLGLHRRGHLDAVAIDIARGPQPERESSGLFDRPARAAESLWPHRGLLAAMLGANAAVLAVAASYLAATGSLEPFAERGPVSLVMIAEALASAGLGILCYRVFWMTPVPGEERPGAAGILFWLGGGLALMWLAVDGFFGLHGAAGRMMDSVPILEHADELVLAGYFICGVVFVRMFGHELNSHQPCQALLVAALIAAAGVVALDLVVSPNNDWKALQRAGQLVTVAFILPAFVIRYRDIQREAAPAWRPV
jgi:hypothetical protein